MKRFKDFINEGGCLLRRFPFINKVKQFINERPFLGGFLTGGIITLLMEIILVLILK